MPYMGVLALAGALAVAEWVVVAFNRRRLNWFFKPAPMLALIAWFTLAGGWQGRLAAVGVALVLSLLGDIFLLFPAGLFLAGLGAFLAAHLAYLVAFTSSPPPINGNTLVIFFAAGTLFGAIVPRVLKGLQGSSGGRKLKTAVAIYAAVLTLMMLSTVVTLFRPEWQPGVARMAATGGVLFFISDTLLGVDRFVREVRFGRLAVMVTYLLAQIALAVAAVMNAQP